MTDAVISIKGIQGGPEGDQDVVELVTDGKYRWDRQGAFVSYFESEVTGLQGTETSVLIKSNSITLKRHGVVNTEMVFRPGEKTKFLFDTQFGSATLGVDTRKINADFDSEGGEMVIDYVVNMDHAVVGRNKIYLSVKKQ